MSNALAITTSYRKRYILAILLIAGLAITAHYTVRHIITTYDQAGILINLSGQQRMLSQKIALHISQLTVLQDNEDLNKINENLQLAISRLENNHTYITVFNIAHLTENQKQLYFEANPSLDSRVKEFTKVASSIFRGQVITAQQSFLFESAHTVPLLADLDKIVKEFEVELTNAVDRLAQIEIWILICTLVLLGLIVMFIFRPLEKLYLFNIQSLVEEKEIISTAKHRSEQANLLKSKFLASMSHEFRTHLSGVFGMLELATVETNKSKRNGHLKKAKVAGKALLRLVNDVLEVARLDAKMVTVNPIDLSLHQVLDCCCAPIAIECEKKGLEFKYHSEGDIPEWINSDPTKLIQTFNYLLISALKLTESGKIEVVTNVEIKNQQAWFKFQVTDNGIGISQQNIDLIRGGFAEVDNSATRQFGGVGLGLNICQQLVTLMGGTLSITSEIGKGSRYYLEMPITISTKPVKQSPSLDIGIVGSFAIVDDLATSREYLASLLMAQGYRVDTYASSSELIGTATHIVEYTAIILDLHMPGLDGKELASVLRAAHGVHCPPLIIVSASPDQINRQEAADSGIEMIFEKPINEKRFCDSIKSLIVKSDPIVTSRNLNILVVEDEDINAEYIKHILSSYGYRSSRALNGVEAIEFAKSGQFDLILMDVNMPVMDGHEASKHIVSELNIAIPIIAISANAFEIDKQKSINAGIKYHLVKPISADELINTIELISTTEIL